MRLSIASAAILLLPGIAARAADLPARAHLDRAPPALAATPMPVMAPVPMPLWLECSPYTAEPITTIYNEPGRTPWSVQPDLALVPLGRVTPSKTRAVYPRGY